MLWVGYSWGRDVKAEGILRIISPRKVQSVRKLKPRDMKPTVQIPTANGRQGRNSRPVSVHNCVPLTVTCCHHPLLSWIIHTFSYTKPKHPLPSYTRERRADSRLMSHIGLEQKASRRICVEEEHLAHGTALGEGNEWPSPQPVF